MYTAAVKELKSLIREHCHKEEHEEHLARLALALSDTYSYSSGMSDDKQSEFISVMQKAFTELKNTPPGTEMSRVCVLFFGPALDAKGIGAAEKYAYVKS